MIGQMISYSSQLLQMVVMASGWAAATHSTASVPWTDLFEADGSRWAMVRTEGRTYIWRRGYFTRTEAELACAGTHRSTEGWTLPTADELGEVLSPDMAGDRFWVLVADTQAYLDQDEGPNGTMWVMRTEVKGAQTPLDVICVRSEDGARDEAL